MLASVYDGKLQEILRQFGRQLLRQPCCVLAPACRCDSVLSLCVLFSVRTVLLFSLLRVLTPALHGAVSLCSVSKVYVGLLPRFRLLCF